MELTVDILNELLNRHAVAVAKKSRVKANPDYFVFHLEENMTNDIVMTAGNPIIVRFNLGIFAKIIINALKDKRAVSHELLEFNNSIKDCYEKGTRYMLRSLSLVPIADVIARDNEFKKWKKTIEKSALLLIADCDISYGVNVQVNAVHIPTGKRVSVHRNVTARETRDQLETKLRVQAKHDLTILVRQPSENTSSTNDDDEVIEG
jgi:hypothetical protein